VGVMLATTFSCVGALKIAYPTQNDFLRLVQTNVFFSPALLWTSYVLSIVLIFGAVCCCSSMLRKTPHNYIFLSVFTILQTYLITYISGLYNVDVVLQAGGTTVLITVLVIAVVKFTKYDFSELLPVMSVCLIAMFFLAIITAIVGSPWLNFVYSCLGVILFTIFLAVDLKMIMGGGKYEVHPDEFVFGAVNLYLDIINIFLYLLQIFGRSD